MSKIPHVMKGVQLTSHGGPETLVYRDDIPVPSPGPRDVLIRVTAAGVNNTDLNTRLGWYSKSEDSSVSGWSGDPMRFPRIQGADVCGWVVAARHAHKIDSKLSDLELASFPCSYSTAENLLTRAKVNANDRVLVTGASGGVGSAVIQLANARGAKVIAVTTPAKSDQIIRLGADRTLARDCDVSEQLGENSIDVVIDLVAGKQWPALLDALKPFGRYATSGAIAGPLVELDLRTLYLKDLTLFGCTVLGKEVFPNLVKRIEAEEVAALVARSFALTEMAEAQKQFETKQHVGKLVIDVSGEG